MSKKQLFLDMHKKQSNQKKLTGHHALTGMISDR